MTNATQQSTVRLVAATASQIVSEPVTLSTPAEGEIAIAIELAGVNPVDVMIGSGAAHQAFAIPADQPMGLGYDAVGVVSAVGEGVDDALLGRRVVTVVPTLGRPYGSFAEALVTSQDAAAFVPDELDSGRAVAIASIGLTARQNLDDLGPANDRTLLVTGAGSGVGGATVQLARRDGWQVVALVRPDRRDAVTLDGARVVTSLDEVADRSVDAVLDAAIIGEELARTVKEGGVFVSLQPPTAVRSDRFDTIVAMLSASGTQLQSVIDDLASGILTVEVEQIYPLDKAKEAVDRVAAGGLYGRVLIQP